MSLPYIESLVSASLCTLILLVQFLIYPSFLYIDKERFKEAMVRHQNRISYIVVPLMATELILSIYGAYAYRSLTAYVSLSLVALIWTSTAFLQVPIHQKLLDGKNDILINRLVKTNYLRVIFWITKFLILEIFPH